MLDVQGIGSGYGDVPVLSDVSLSVGADEIVSVVGANGAGKTTLLSTISGLLPCTAGTIRFDGEPIERLAAHDVVTRRLVMVPEGGRLFPFMTVLENLELGAFNTSARPNLKASLDDVLAHFPILAERRAQLAGSLSGGERQMCAIARAMMSQPKLLMLDEPSLGLSPLMVERVFDLVLSLVREKNIAVLLVEQNVGDALGMANRGYIIEHGRVIKSGTGDALLADQDVQRAYLGL
ncbi:MAG TPA: ABC transporter ATP-binding protein [Xanthobacteraceae bacterium]|nr:ABC transporter ATP-binding protein [Xanthobacteraceae bacterium]